MQVKDLHIDYAESKDEASVVDNGGALEEDADVDDGGVDADLCDSRPARLALEAAIGSSNPRVSAIGLEFEIHGTDFPREAA